MVLVEEEQCTLLSNLTLLKVELEGGNFFHHKEETEEEEVVEEERGGEIWTIKNNLQKLQVFI